MNEHYINEDELEELVAMMRTPDEETKRHALQAWLGNLHKQGITHLTRQLHSLRDDFQEKKAVIDHLGLPLLQTKRAFAWNEPRPPIAVPDRLRFRSFAEIGYEAFFDIVGKAHQATLDRAMQDAIRTWSRQQTSQAKWLKTEFEAATTYFDYEPDWWQVAYTPSGQAVGYVQPVLFQNGDQDGLREATLYYIGVVPEARGNGYVNDLLAKSMAILQSVGIWRIYSDTDSENFPMIRAFQKAGFAEDGLYYIWQGDLTRLIDKH